ncbi:response regulator [Hymenobacter glacieicola]|uniref:Response regulator n=1 Tax=Hymenobacter glacieicola TaxID=1562124 RepID=A0ABQ1WLM3_9BACT|nr:response regulator [Hymenobacter glacieicola]GGG31755.1 response regulator [Hymenobacter glacieicola]
MNTTAIKPILIVEDSTEDFTALGRAFRKHALQNPVLRCEDGEQALDYLQGQGKGRMVGWPQALPAIILLDLNMPGLDGRDVLGAIKGDPSLQSIPVVMFTTSANAKDVAACYQLGANSYLTKPLAYADLEEKVRLIVHYWLEASELPA